MDMIPSYVTIAWLLTITAIIGNGLVIYLIIITKQLHTTTNWFILSLAAADLSFAVCFFPVAFFCETTFACDNVLRGIIAWQFATIAIANLCAMATDRYIVIVTPFKYVRIMNKRRVLLLTGCAWEYPLFYIYHQTYTCTLSAQLRTFTFYSKSYTVFSLRYCLASFS